MTAAYEALAARGDAERRRLAGRHPRASLNGHQPANGRAERAEPEVWR